jgi:hypothetical protein
MRRLILAFTVFCALSAAAAQASACCGYYGGGCYYYYHITFRGAPSPQFLSTILPQNDSWRYVYYCYPLRGGSNHYHRPVR